MQVKYAYLDQQFAEVEEYFRDLRHLVATGEFTLGPYVEAFERDFASYIGVKHAIGTNTGTGALTLALKAVGVKPSDEVVTVANTFIATVGAIIAVGARPVLVDCDDRYQLDPGKLESAVTPRTTAIIPVHWAGCSPDMEAIMWIADRHGVPVVEDACPAVGASVNGKAAGTFGMVNAFSMHPLKPLNVWGDGGVIVTNDDRAAEFLRLYRNHGLRDRDHAEIWGVNERLQPFQAIVARRVLATVDRLVERRIHNASRLDAGLKNLHPHVRLPHLPPGNREAFQLYLCTVERREELLQHIISRGVEAKVHYPIPIHLQRAAEHLGYKRGDFPVCERQADEIVTLPAHQHISDAEIDYVVSVISDFYEG